MYAALRLAQNGTVIGRFHEFDLATGFQSIVRLDTLDVVGYDAYARSHAQDGDVVSPWGLFSHAADDATVTRLDRLCRLVHTVNYFSQAGSDVPLYLRVHGRLLAAITQDHGKAFRYMIDALGIPPSSIVLQLPADAAQDVLLIGIIIDNYKKAGFKVGVNARGLQEAQSMIHLHGPDVLKIELGALAEPARHVPALLQTARQRSTQVVFKRVENDQSAALLKQCGAEFGQGYLFDTPRARLAADAIN
jgi:EAL domain-containing protein (putative c-di-GMP-specific phosphodiesterase class I)